MPEDISIEADILVGEDKVKRLAENVSKKVEESIKGGIENGLKNIARLKESLNDVAKDFIEQFSGGFLDAKVLSSIGKLGKELASAVRIEPRILTSIKEYGKAGVSSLERVKEVFSSKSLAGVKEYSKTMTSASKEIQSVKLLPDVKEYGKEYSRAMVSGLKEMQNMKLPPDVKEYSKLLEKSEKMKSFLSAKEYGGMGVLPDLSKVKEVFSPGGVKGFVNSIMGVVSGKGVGVGGAGVSGGGGGGIKGAGAGMGALTVAVAMGDIIVELLKKAVDFLMNLEPIKALTDVIDNILKLFFMPLALMLMMILLPIFKAIIGALGSASWTAFMKIITDIGKTIGDLFASFISVLGKQNLITGLKALFLLIATPVIALGIVVASIVTLITAIVSAVGFLINLVRAGIGEIVGGYKEFVSLVNKFWSDVVKGISDIAGWLSGAFISAVKEIIAGIGIVVKFFSDVWSWITGGVNAVLKLIGNGISEIVNVVLGIWDWLNRILGGFLSSIMSVFNSIESILSKIPHFQSGGYVPSNTLAVLHAGEVVVPSNIVKEAKSVGGNSFVISINMSNNISSNVDVQRLADDIERELEKRLRRLRTW